MANDTRILIFQKAPNYVTYNAGDVIYEQGESSEPMYVIQDGEVEMILHPQLRETLGPGDILGEMSMITGEPHSHTAIAKTHVRVVPVDKARFLFMVQETPNFAVAVMEIMIERMRKLNDYLVKALDDKR